MPMAAPAQLRTPAVWLLDVLPELVEHLDPQQAYIAGHTVTAPVVSLAPGDCERSDLLPTGVQPFAAIVLSGVLSRHVDIGGHPGLCFFSRGDVIGSAALRDEALTVGEAWSIAIPARLAILDDRFLVAARRWPRLVSGLVSLIQEQHDRLTLHLVIAQQPRVETRVLALLWHFAERFGRVTSEGVVVDLAMTHESIGRLIGAQRPTVSLALKELRRRGAGERRADGSWLITEPATAEMGTAPSPAALASFA
jgi:CRP/FNR family cyclic AMP-dependent transcriptional regulator